MTSSLFAERSRLLALVLHRGGERLDIERFGNLAAEEGDPDGLSLSGVALDGDEEAWRFALVEAFLREHPSLRGLMQSYKSEVHVMVLREVD